MGRIRSIKPELPLDEELAELGFAARYFFINLWCQCDKAGRCEDRPKKLQAQILPWDKIDAEKLLSELCPKFIVRYQIDGRRFIQVRTWEKNQRPLPQEKESVIPPATEKDLEYNKGNTKVIPRTLWKGVIGSGRESLEGEREGGGSRRIFIPPSLEEVRAYCQEQKNGVDPEAFLAHYTTVGWVYGRNKIPVKCWKSCVTTWKKNQKRFSVSELTQ